MEQGLGLGLHVTRTYVEIANNNAAGDINSVFDGMGPRLQMFCYGCLGVTRIVLPAASPRLFVSICISIHAYSLLSP